MADRNGGLNPLEGHSATLFLVGAVMFLVSTGLVVAEIVAGAERLGSMVAEAFIAAGWIAALGGLLGLHPVLADRNRWLTRAGGVFAAIGVVAYTALAVASLVVFFTGGSGAGDSPIPLAFVLPGVIIGSLLGFVSFSVASLRSDVYSRTVGALLLVPSGIYVTNFLVLPVILGYSGDVPGTIAVVVGSALVVAMLAIGYALRTDSSPTDRKEVEPSPDSAAD